MNLKQEFCLLVAGGCLWLGISSVWAQQPPATPVLDALDKQAIEIALKLAQTANDACKALDSVKLYDDQRTYVVNSLRSKYPGYILNWQTKRLEPQGAK